VNYFHDCRLLYSMLIAVYRRLREKMTALLVRQRLAETLIKTTRTSRPWWLHVAPGSERSFAIVARILAIVIDILETEDDTQDDEDLVDKCRAAVREVLQTLVCHFHDCKPLYGMLTAVRRMPWSRRSKSRSRRPPRTTTERNKRQKVQGARRRSDDGMLDYSLPWPGLVVVLPNSTLTSMLSSGREIGGRGNDGGRKKATRPHSYTTV
jgi:hypothetical protein